MARVLVRDDGVKRHLFGIYVCSDSRGPTPSGFAYDIYKSHNFKLVL